MKKLIYVTLLLFIGLKVSAQNYWTPGTMPGSTGFSPTWRFLGTDSTANFSLANGTKSYRMWTAVQSNSLFAPVSGSGNYIQNGTPLQTGASFNIDGSGQILTTLSIGNISGGIYGGQLEASSNTSGARGINISQHSNDNFGAELLLSKSKGTRAAPVAVASGDYGGVSFFSHYDGSSYPITALIGSRITGTPSVGYVPTEIFMSVSTANDVNPYTSGNVKFKVQPTGTSTIGDANISGNTYLGGNINITGVASITKMYPTTLGPDSIMAHGSDGKLKIIAPSAFSGSYITTNTTQTGLTGDKQSTGNYTVSSLKIAGTAGAGYQTFVKQTTKPTFSTNGDQLMFADSTLSGYNRLIVGGNTNTDRNFAIYNSNAGNKATSSIMIWSDVGRVDGVVTSSTYNQFPSTLITANQGILVGNGTNSLLFGMETAGDVIMIAGGNGASSERLRLISGGGVTSQGLFKMQAITLASTPASQTAGLDVSVTSAGTNATYYPVGIRAILSAGYTGGAGSRGATFINNVAGTGTDAFSAGNINSGSADIAQATTTGTNVGTYAIGLGGNISYGIFGLGFDDVKASSVHIGVAGFATNTGTSGIKIGGYFGNKSSAPSYTNSAALIADGDGTNPVFLGKVNGTTNVSITGTGILNIGGSSLIGAQFTSSSNGGAGTRGLSMEMHSNTAGDGLAIYGLRSGGTLASPAIAPANSYGFDLEQLVYDGSTNLITGDMGYRLLSTSLGSSTGEYYFSLTPSGTGGSDPYTLGSVKFKISSTAVTSLVPLTATRLNISTGSNNGAGTATLVAGTVTVSNTSITASSIILLTRQTIGGTTGTLSYTLSAGTSFTINSSSATDTSTIGYVIVN